MQATAGMGFLFQEFGDIVRENGTPFSWTALLAGMAGPDSHRPFLEQGQKLQDQGLDVYPQVTCRPLLFEFQFAAPFPFESLPYFKPVSEAGHEGKKRIYADPEFRARFKQKQPGGITGSWEETIISDCPQDPSLNERPLCEVAAEFGADPVDLALDLALASDLQTRFRMAIFNTDEEAVAELLTHPSVVLGLSDAGAHATRRASRTSISRSTPNAQIPFWTQITLSNSESSKAKSNASICRNSQRSRSPERCPA